MTKKYAIITPSVLDDLSREITKAKTSLGGLDGINAYIHIGNAEDMINGLYGDLVETDKITEAVIKTNLPEYPCPFNLKYRFQ
jgi:hypothetical protein